MRSRTHPRARRYSPTSGRFNRLDPFFGRLQDPLSLHKYLYVHGDPVQGVDPSGLWTYTGLAISTAIVGIVATSTLLPVVTKVSKPDWWWSLIPVIGPVWDAAYNFQEGNIGWGVFYTAMAATDVFLIKALVTSGVRAVARVGELGVRELAPQLAKVAGGSWLRRPGGIRIMQSGKFFVKEVDPAASGFVRWFGKTTIEEQARALRALGDMAPKYFYKDGRLIIENAGRWQGTFAEFLGLRLRGSWRMGELFTDIVPRNIGEAGLIFDPALHSLHVLVEWLGTYMAWRTLTYGVVKAYE